LRASDLPEEVRRLIADHIDSVEQLEILLLLYQHPERTWDAEAVARELRIASISAGERLEDMAQSGLLARKDGKPVEYRYAPESESLDAAVRGLSTAYSERRVTVINLIFSKPVDKIRTFADAFRIRRDDDNG
jgi:DNA-binding MarR family transcriptional regulator